MKGPERLGPGRQEYDRNRKKILKTQNICAICGKPVDKSLAYPHPMSASIDHIIPIARGGHPSDIANLQLTHLRCNRYKSDKMPGSQDGSARQTMPGVKVWDLPATMDWKAYRSKG